VAAGAAAVASPRNCGSPAAAATAGSPLA